MRALVMTAAASLVLANGAMAAGGNAQSGQQVFQRCAICHSHERGEGNRLGPNLFGIVGRKAGSVASFSYSPAMKNAGFVWTDQKLNAYLKSPPAVVPGNRMAFAGISSESDRANLVAYLDTLK
jgi:cytochrome c